MDTVTNIFISKLVEAITSFIQEELVIVKTAKAELVSLREKLQTIKSTVSEAERRPFFQQKEIKSRMMKLKGVIFDAEDVIEEHQVKMELNKKAEGASSITTTRSGNKVSKAFTCLLACFRQHLSHPHELGHNIKKINEQLDQIINDSVAKKKIESILSPSNTSQTAAGATAVGVRATTSSLIEGEEVGRENDKSVLIKHLLQGDVVNKRNFSVVAIVGKGGLGKTYLAKMIFNDEQVKNHFARDPWWVCVSEKPNRIDLLRKLLEAVKAPEHSQELEILCNRLRDAIKDKKFLLVLDDVWDLEWWETLEAPLQEGAPGSKVLITTRKGDLMETFTCHMYKHCLGEFSWEESWNLFLKQVNETEMLLKEKGMIEIGERIVKKCGALPLVIKSVGSLLRTKKMVKREWESIEKSEIWSWEMHSSSSYLKNDESVILPGLILSYDDLEPHLKNCFVYCSLFPKDFEMKRERLTQQWIANGLVEEKKADDIEQTANNYLDELVSRCLLELGPLGDDYLLMHDVIHDLAQYIGDKEYSYDSVTENTRHLFLDCRDVDDSLEQNRVKSGDTKLRTLQLQSKIFPSFLPIGLTANLKGLRVLGLNKCDMKVLPDCICKLLHLRYLDLSGSSIEQLPESIGKLYNLQSLNLYDTKIKALPIEIGDVGNLRHLYFDGDCMKFIPESIGKLTNLRSLESFIVFGDGGINESGCSLRELKGLNKLKGRLVISGLDRVKDGNDARDTCLDKKCELTELELIFSEQNISSEDRVHPRQKEQEDVIDHLRPPRGLEKWGLSGYMGEQLPRWFFEERGIAKEVSLDWCPNVKVLPLLPVVEKMSLNKLPNSEGWSAGDDELPRVKFFEISDCPGLKALPRLPVVEDMNLSDLDKWVGWSTREDHSPTLSCLKTLRIDDCPKFNLLPPLLPTLENIHLQGLPDWEGWSDGAPTLPCLKRLWIGDCPKCKVLPPLLPTLQYIDLKGLADWEGWLDGAAAFPCLKRLSIGDCPKFKVLPHQLLALQYIDVYRLPDWEGWSDGAELPCLMTLWIADCPKFKVLPPLLPTLENIHLQGLPDWEGWSDGAAAFPCLERLTIADCPKFKVLPPLLSTLEDIDLKGLPDWEGWSDGAELPCLKELSIADCPKFKLLPHLLPTLEYIDLEGLPNWEGWWGGNDGAAMPCLKEVNVSHCPHLSSFPSNFASLLEESQPS